MYTNHQRWFTISSFYHLHFLWRRNGIDHLSFIVFPIYIFYEEGIVQYFSDLNFCSGILSKNMKKYEFSTIDLDIRNGHISLLACDRHFILMANLHYQGWAIIFVSFKIDITGSHWPRYLKWPYLEFGVW